ncbi:MAG: hypothetical protein H6813_06220 [Phycisphaeraceae bacterium]|nr:hypothetical protein [Phycisphaeraceae bacterium]MCB9848066.1 hypothetical protein [Phycisphaeraceae bacterium]
MNVHKRFLALAAVSGAMLLCGAAQAGVTQTVFALSDHPDGDVNPPPYGLRFDDLFTEVGGTGGVTSFSMDHFGDSTLTVTDDGVGGLTIDIVGTLYGGVDTGSGYGYGEGAFALDYTYAVSVMADGSGWVVNSEDPMNSGTLTVLPGNANLTSGTVFNFFGRVTEGGPIFVFKNDGHRLGGHPEFDPLTTWVGRGWHETDTLSGSTHDFLFVGELIPAPGAGMLLVGGGLIAGTRRRR